MITAKFPFTVPDPPGRPQVIDWDTSNATLQWERPVHDGGSKIQGYKIEIRFVFLAKRRLHLHLWQCREKGTTINMELRDISQMKYVTK